MARPRIVQALLCALALTLAVGLSGCGSSAPRGHDLISIVQDDALLRINPTGTLDAMRALGAQVVRSDLVWSHFAPDPDSPTGPAFDASDPNAYPPSSWTTYDEIDRAAAARGLRLYLTLTGPGPIWAAGPGMPDTRNCPCGQWEPSAAEFGAFVHAVGDRYSGHFVPPGASTPLPRVSFWSIWNEPNYGPNLAPQAVGPSQVDVSPRLYRGLLDAAWRALGATGHTTRTDTILVGETAPRGQTGPSLPGDFGGMVPLRFIRALYCVGRNLQPLRGTAASAVGCPRVASSARFTAANPALFHATGWADHPYPDGAAPNVATPRPLGGGYADFAALGNLERTLDGAAKAYGEDPRLPIYSTEFGYNSLLLTGPPAAGDLNQAEYLSWLSPRIRSFDQYLLMDAPPSSKSLFLTGLEDFRGRPKPTLAAYRMPLWLPVTRAPRSQPLLVWGCARAAPLRARATGRAQQVQIEFARPGGVFRPVRSVTLTGAGGCYFEVTVRFPGSGSVRLGWLGPDGALHSRIQPITSS